ncbi:hypothetical protein M406DRAFT_350380 [Cryphonectria parasitica EP155]|uniref:Uncharacterized protein n=1 Tax=Cryphonectria parasitica (strain ATCC 38755 / EP155) TaxID=660469 RepID=A0A9P5CQ09_CRYP1|nr:uncharacterized protein M406DRAFT_350380 [Cryphonectria parasitica EP155]KAF3767044.1 hypothetical protein M406DRAFT_350380 [Cryphonectria parasitica EP155]
MQREDASTPASEEHQPATPKDNEETPYWQQGGEQASREQEQQVAAPKKKKKNPLKLRLDLNLEIEIELKARIHGDLELALLGAPRLAMSSSQSSASHLVVEHAELSITAASTSKGASC